MKGPSSNASTDIMHAAASLILRYPFVSSVRPAVSVEELLTNCHLPMMSSSVEICSEVTCLVLVSVDSLVPEDVEVWEHPLAKRQQNIKNKQAAALDKLLLSIIFLFSVLLLFNALFACVIRCLEFAHFRFQCVGCDACFRGSNARPQNIGAVQKSLKPCLACE